MPARNVIKPYVAQGYYHVYNRGVNKADIFLDEQDYGVFLSYLKTYLLPKDVVGLQKKATDLTVSWKERANAQRQLRLNNFHDRIDLVVYCLMPNHFHLLLRQQGEREMESFVQSLMTRYTAYGNRRYKRFGPLFQGTYKAVIMESDEQLLYVSRYIHRNPLSFKRLNLLGSQPTSYADYLGFAKQEWVKPLAVLAHFGTQGFTSYQSFVESNDDGLEEVMLSRIRHAMIDD
ncbi:MAG: transposase [Patescibacteria group bacterium]